MPYNPAAGPLAPVQPNAVLNAAPCPPHCPPIVRVGGNNFSEDNLRICFPKDYFVRVQSYLRAIQQQIPSDVVDQVYWALDAWFHINACLYALNIPYTGVKGLHGFGGGESTGVSDSYQPIRPIAVLEPFYKAIEQFYVYAEAVRVRNASALRRQTANPFYVEAAQTARLYPAPFMSLIPMWSGGVGRNIGYGNPIGTYATAGLLPWMARGVNPPQNLTWNAKSADDWKRVGTDPAFARALGRWRWWSLRDDYPWGARKAELERRNQKEWNDPNYMPRFMGSIDNTTPLGTYLSRIVVERGKSDVYYDGARWYPSVGYTCHSGISKMIGLITGMNYDATVRNHVSIWLKKSQPELDAAGNIKTFMVGNEARKAPTPVTGVDLSDILKQNSKAVRDRLNAAIEDPTVMCDGDAACLKANQIAQKFADFPVFKQFHQAAQKVMFKLAELLGAAEGWYYVPFHLMNHPFIRSVQTPGWTTVVSGSTKTIIAREMTAITAIQETLQIHIAPWLPPQWGAPRAQMHAEIVLDAQGNPVYRVQAIPPPPGVPPVPFDESGACDRVIDMYLSANQMALGPTDRMTAHKWCLQEAFRKTVPAGTTEAFLNNIKAQRVGPDGVPLLAAPRRAGIPWGLVAMVGAAGAAVLVLRK